MKILVTGGAGFVGSVLVPELLKEGYEVRVLDYMVHKQPSLIPHFISDKFEFIKGDIRNKQIVEKAVNGVDLIIHLAAIVGAPACRKDRRLTEEVNYKGTINIDEARDQSQKLIYPSTGSVYGTIEGICTEESKLNPLTTYAKTKLMAEQHIMKSGNAVIFRFATGFGLSPRIRLDLMPNDFVFQALKNKSLIVYEKDFRRTFIHVKDMAKSFIFGIKNYDKLVDGVYNVGDDEMNYTKEDIALEIKKKIDYFLHFAEIDSDPDKRDYEVSYKKINDQGFKCAISLSRGIDELIKGCQMIYLKNPYSNVEE